MGIKISKLRRAIRPIVRETCEEVLEDLLHEENFIKNKMQEMILESGLLSHVISETLQGTQMANQRVIYEQPRSSKQMQPAQQRRPSQQHHERLPEEGVHYSNQPAPDGLNIGAELRASAEERRKQLEQNLGMPGIFEGTAPMADNNPVPQTAEFQNERQIYNQYSSDLALKGTAPNDAGIDLDLLMGNDGKKKMNIMKETVVKEE